MFKPSNTTRCSADLLFWNVVVSSVMGIGLGTASSSIVLMVSHSRRTVTSMKNLGKQGEGRGGEGGRGE